MPAGVEKKPSTFLLGMFPPSEEANYPSLHLRGMPPRKAAARRKKKAVEGKRGVCQVAYLLKIVLLGPDRRVLFRLIPSQAEEDASVAASLCFPQGDHQR